MSRKNDDDKLRNAIAKAFATQVQRTLDVMRVRGWEFPANCDVGVTVVASTPLALKVNVRVDQETMPATIASTNPGDDITKAVDALVAAWLAKNAIKRPPPARRA